MLLNSSCQLTFRWLSNQFINTAICSCVERPATVNLSQQCSGANLQLTELGSGLANKNTHWTNLFCSLRATYLAEEEDWRLTTIAFDSLYYVTLFCYVLKLNNDK